MAEVDQNPPPLDGEGPALPPRKKLKLSDLPISQTKRSAIDGLHHTFRKKGEYDAMRKQIFAQFEASPAKDALLASIEELVDRETDRDPSLLSKDPRLAATLIEGAGERSDIYKDVSASLNQMIDEFCTSQGIQKMREYRVQEIGAELAAEEEKRGSKADEDYIREADARREERAAKRAKELEEELEKERQEKARKDERRRREKEEEAAREKERRERDERRRKEREEREKEEEERRRQDRERIEKEREEKRARKKKEDEEWEAQRSERIRRERERHSERYGDRYSRRSRSRSRSRDRRRDRSRDRRRDDSRSRSRSRSRGRGADRRNAKARTKTPEPPKPVNLDDIKVDDDAALQALLQESEQMKKSRQRPALERSESLDPPMRKPLPPKSLVPRDPVPERSSKAQDKTQSPEKQDAGAAEQSSKSSKDEDTPMPDAPASEKADEKKPISRFDLPPPAKPEEKSRVARDLGPAEPMNAGRDAMTTATLIAPVTIADAGTETEMTVATSVLAAKARVLIGALPARLSPVAASLDLILEVPHHAATETDDVRDRALALAVVVETDRRIGVDIVALVLEILVTTMIANVVDLVTATATATITITGTVIEIGTATETSGLEVTTELGLHASMLQIATYLVVTTTTIEEIEIVIEIVTGTAMEIKTETEIGIAGEGIEVGHAAAVGAATVLVDESNHTGYGMAHCLYQ
ncbi:hypothetical protein BU24DRAFT_466017 [Aaosphaeria arxii CBS 175.79]|uniref:BOD1/SHG1 domain-containing protein n=1 Tax=Aaosphaeria arxii CBS 175.79 TaxID=1450172 RepID=A0A6A5XEQ4_9PLEO|nr:uncharacterized protein BU24DRAFT_466017 [Aaosphaeria arxii CBS 175.79]KAF2011287.1 hypothetical protein BU24DRAFT_466017 [Aaosphaeria arxii CBS 175.79]